MRRLTTIKSRSKFDIIILGNTDVGKSSLIKRLIDEEAAKLSVPTATVGAEYKVKTISLPNAYIKLNICDCSGQERFRQLLRAYYSICQGAVIVYDMQNRESFEEAKDWVIELREKVSPDMLIALAANKADMETNRTVSKAEGLEYAKDNDLIYMETSSWMGLNVKNIFKALAMALNNKKIEEEKKERNAISDKDKEKHIDKAKNTDEMHAIGCCCLRTRCNKTKAE
ncbi:hypothetical protein ACLKA7_004228 [Drosophila subpalustris]